MFTPEVLYGLGALVLAAALAWGVLQARSRNRANDPLTREATRAEYDDPEGYAREQAEYRDRARPASR